VIRTKNPSAIKSGIASSLRDFCPRQQRRAPHVFTSLQRFGVGSPAHANVRRHNFETEH
jgi:hypothetical protein